MTWQPLDKDVERVALRGGHVFLKYLDKLYNQHIPITVCKLKPTTYILSMHKLVILYNALTLTCLASFICEELKVFSYYLL